MARIKYQGKYVGVVPGQLILDSGMNVFGLHLFMESVKDIPDGVPPAFAFEHRGVRIVIDSDPEKTDTDIDEPRRLQLKEGREHLTVTDEFQSDKYPWCPAGFVPIKITDPLAMDLLSEYADRRRVIDAEFTRDLNEALLVADIPADPGSPAIAAVETQKEKNHD